MRRIAEDVICYLVAAHILAWTAWYALGRLIEEAVK
jgi:hypothetical protein